ncbi:MAG: ABC transporter substrate-binding protein [Deltaproteobacteria bacterium]|nr:ABC transporter substrate-binding protein [Deltaproteobacteria bacterium]
MKQKIQTKWQILVGIAVIASLMIMLPQMAFAAGGHLRVAYGLEASSLDPHMGRSGGDAYYWKQMYDLLVGADSKLVSQASLSLATSWETPDPQTMVFQLRKGVKFHDGTDFNAEAVKFNIERILDPKGTATPKASFSVIERVEVVDPYTVKFHLKRPWGAGLSMLADRGGAMNSPTAIKKLGKKYGFHVVGTGPFKLVEYLSGSHCKLAKNKDYWGKDAAGNSLPYLDEITMKMISDPAVSSAALRTGELDLSGLHPKDVDKFQADPKFNMSSFQGSGIGHLLYFNKKMKPMDNVNLRLAIAHAINPEMINKAIFYGKAIVAKGGFWPTGTWVFDETVPRPTYNLEKAKEYLKKGGMPNGFTLDIDTWKSSTVLPAAEMVKAQLAQIGVKVNIHVFDVGTATEKFFHTNEFPIYNTSWSRYPEPDWVASLCYKSKGYYNPDNLDRPDMDKLIRAGAASYDINERKAIYRKVNEIILGEAWVVPYIYGVSYYASWKKVQGMDTFFSWDAKFLLKELSFKK